jgi:alanyl-tRNA synthetase
MRRIEAVTGRVAESFIEEGFSTLEGVATQLGTTPAEVQEKLAAVLHELAQERKRAKTLEEQLLRKVAQSLLSEVQQVDGIAVLAAKVSASNMEVLRQMGDWLKEKLGSAVIVLGVVWDDKPRFLAMVTPDLAAKGIHAGEIVKQVAQVTGGSGGGRAEIGQAGGKDKKKLDEALNLVAKLIKKA